jgi:hypothetical protein
MSPLLRAVLAALMLIAAGATLAQHTDPGAMAGPSAASPDTAVAQALLEKIKSLEGTWDASMGDGVWCSVSPA